MRSNFVKFVLVSGLLAAIAMIAVSASAQSSPVCGTWGSNQDVQGCITNNGNGTITVVITNNSTRAQNVGVASYYKYVNNADQSIPNQELFDYETGRVANRGQQISFTINIPDCSTQVDVFVGDVIYSFTSQNDLYAGRKIVYTHINTASPCDPGNGDEGCTPGYWKNHDGYWSQKARPYVEVFFADLGYLGGADQHLYNTLSNHGAIGQVMLDNALSYRGNRYKFEALLRASAAGLLSASHPNVDYPLLARDVVLLTRQAWYAWIDRDYATVELIKNQLDGYNNLGCTLNHTPYP